MPPVSSGTARGPRRWERGLVTGAVVVGVILRYLAATRGHNFDFDSFRVVTDVVQRGGNVYAETSRYNYGPIWFHLLHLFDDAGALLDHDARGFRVLLVTFLTAVDLGIFFLLRRVFGIRPALLFFLNPISIVITGYHNQFDNLAVFVAMVAVLMSQRASMTDNDEPSWLGLTVLGISLVIKHVFFAFPLWWALKCKSWPRAVAAAVVPVVLFVAAFIPYWTTSRDGIIAHVFLYKSFDNAPLWHCIVPGALRTVITPKILFALALVAGGFLFRAVSLVHALFLYTLVLVSFSPAIANQYLVIVVPAVAVYWNLPFAVYTVVGSLMVVGNADGLHSDAVAALLPVRSAGAYEVAVLALLLGLILTAARLGVFSRSAAVDRVA